MEFIDVSAKTIEDAIAKGVAQLAEDGQELVETKVLEQPSNGFLGIGRKPAVVRLFFTSVAKTATLEEVAHVEEQSVAVASKPVATSETEVQDTAVETSEDDVVEKPSKKELSKEDQQEIAEKGKQFLDDMFTQMGLTVVIEKMMTKDKISKSLMVSSLSPCRIEGFFIFKKRPSHGAENPHLRAKPSTVLWQHPNRILQFVFILPEITLYGNVFIRHSRPPVCSLARLLSAAVPGAVPCAFSAP